MASIAIRIPVIWWLHPAALFAMVGCTVVLAAWSIPAYVYETTWGTQKYFDDLALLHSFASIALFGVGVVISRPRTAGGEDNPAWAELVNWSRALTLFRIAYRLCFTGYAIWISAAIYRGADLALLTGVLTGEKDASYLMKDTYLVTLGGLTTFTQFGIAGVILGCVLSAAGYWRAVRLPLFAMFGLAVMRSIFNSERLAIIELLVPAAVILMQLPAATARLRRNYTWVFYIFPIVSAIAVFILFTGSEYFRSWVNHYAAHGESIWEFAAIRLSGYYVTASNNSAYLLQQPNITAEAPYYTILFLWRFPVVNLGLRWLFPRMMEGPNDLFTELLRSGTNPEFNNNGGLLLPMVDYDIFGGLLYWLVVGMICGWCYRSYRRNAIGGILFYPILLLGILEIPRIIYWAEGRVFPTLVFLLIAVRLLRASGLPAAVPGKERAVCAV